MMRLRVLAVRACPPILGFFPAHSRSENLALTALQRPLTCPLRPSPPWNQHSSEREVPIFRVDPRTIMQAHLSRHSMSPRLTTTRCIRVHLHLAAVINGMLAQGTVVLSTHMPPGPNPVHCHTRHMSVHHLASTLLGIAIAPTSDTLNFQPHHQLLHSLLQDCHSWGLITFEIIIQMDTRQVTKIPSGRHSTPVRLELTQNFRLPSANHLQTFTKANSLLRDLTLEHIPSRVETWTHILRCTF